MYTSLSSVMIARMESSTQYLGLTWVKCPIAFPIRAQEHGDWYLIPCDTRMGECEINPGCRQSIAKSVGEGSLYIVLRSSRYSLSRLSITPGTVSGQILGSRLKCVPHLREISMHHSHTDPMDGLQIGMCHTPA